MATIVDSYSESNQDSSLGLNAGGTTAMGQSFTGDGKKIVSAKFYLVKFGSPTGNAVAKLYAHSGTFGTDSVPTGSALATSDNFDVSTLNTSPNWALKTFTFSGANQVALTNGTKYVIVIEYTGGNASNRPIVAIDVDTPGHAGNSSRYAGSWAANAADVCFYVYGDPAVVGPANLKTYNTNLSANIKTINTNPIANVKSLNTNT